MRMNEESPLRGDDVDGELRADAAQALLQQAPVAIAVLGPDLRFRFVNGQWRVLTDRHDLLGRRWDDTFADLAATRLPAALHEVLQSGTPQTVRETPLVLSRDARPQRCFLRFHLEPRHDASGRV